MFQDVAKEVFEIESQAISNLANLLTDDFDRAVDFILSTSGRVIICGMGKSGIIGKKVAATLASTGTPSFFMHPGEAYHGDLGMVTSEDVFVAISNSGETDEVLKLIPYLSSNRNKVISITGNPESTLAKNSHCHLNIKVDQEACPLQLAPTASTTATAAVGDALAVALMKARNFEPENFARFHPGGALGKALLTRVKDVTNWAPPICAPTDKFDLVLEKISAGRMGVCIVKKQGEIGVITDGDLRRTLQVCADPMGLIANDMTTWNPHVISGDDMLPEAKNLMEEKKVTCLIVEDATHKVSIGCVTIHDI